MSASKFLRVLQDVGYKVDLQPAAIEWAFDDPAVRPLLQCICDHVTAQHALTADERHRFTELQNQGKVIKAATPTQSPRRFLPH